MPRTHGYAVGYRRTPEYAVWLGIKDRIKRKPEYVGRGIAMCDRWRRSFPDFLADVGPKPSPAHWIERKDNDGHYEPSNVQWATIKEQTRNRRTSRLLALGGITRCVTEWSEILGIPVSTITCRIDRGGWSVERALSTPIRGTRA